MREDKTRRSIPRLGASMLCIALIAACGSDDDDEGSQATSAPVATSDTATSTADTSGDGTAATEPGNDDAAAAAEFVAPYLTEPTSIGITEPLGSKPPAGKTVAWLEANVESVQIFTPRLKAGAEALGWDLEVISYDQASVQSLNTALQQAVTKGVDYVVCTACGSEQFPTALAAAKAADIPVVQLNTPLEDDQASKGILACIACDSQFVLWGELVSNWIIADSDAKGKVVYVTLPDFPILEPETTSVKETFAAKCAECELDVLESTTMAFVGGEIPQQVVSYVQTHPDVEYLYFSAALTTGVREALDAAGIGQNIKIVNVYPGLADVAAITAGKQTATVTLPTGTEAWAALDAMARDSIGENASVAESTLPTMIWTADNAPNPPELFDGPADYEAQFKKLWAAS